MTAINRTFSVEELVGLESSAEIEAIIFDTLTIDFRGVQIDDQLLFEPTMVQIVLSVCSRARQVRINWRESFLKTVLSGVNLFPLPCALLFYPLALHFEGDKVLSEKSVDAIQLLAVKQKFSADAFSDSFVFMSSDNQPRRLNHTLYNTLTRSLAPRSNLEGLINDYFFAKRTTVAYDEAKRDAVSAMLFELVENSHDHGRQPRIRGIGSEANAMERQVASLRMVIVRHVLRNKGKDKSQVPCLELSVLDTGEGCFQNYTKAKLNSAVPADEEWGVLLQCLDKRARETKFDDTRGSVRGFGLAEVLRTTHKNRGGFSIRTGRLFGERGFFPSDLEWGINPPDHKERPGQPNLRLLDSGTYSPVPIVQRSQVIGTLSTISIMV